MSVTAINTLLARRFGIDTYLEPVVYIRADSPVCRSEGFAAQTRVTVGSNGTYITATLNVVTSDLLPAGEIGLSDAAWNRLGVAEGTSLRVSHAEPLQSMSHVRAKVFGQKLDDVAFASIVNDIVSGRYSDVETACFITAAADDRLDVEEMISLTQAMVDTGERLTWPSPLVVDKHCVGGLPGNRTTLIVVPIIAACGLTIPKTSSRAITSPAGTADTMETLTEVTLDLPAMRRVVEREGGCVVWGGGVRLSPADDVFIRVERALELDSTGQLVASILSKKAAAGATHVLIDVPVGPTAKIRSANEVEDLRRYLVFVGKALGLTVDVVVSEGTQPVGRGVGPALEALDVLSVLRNEAGAPADLRERSVMLAGRILELSGQFAPGQGRRKAADVLHSGAAERKFTAICEAQGGMRTPSLAPHSQDVIAPQAGIVTLVDNRRLAKIAKLAGAPHDAAAGLRFLAPIGARVEKGQPLFTIFAESPGELAYALDYTNANPLPVHLAEER